MSDRIIIKITNGMSCHSFQGSASRTIHPLVGIIDSTAQEQFIQESIGIMKRSSNTVR